jgi:two-component system, chemotaxis family, protein-glutamate methylesterase/glutaminase
VAATLAKPDWEVRQAARIKVAVVDDSLITRTLLLRCLAGCHDIDVAGTASDGKAALQLLREQPVDVVLLDIAMPVMDGLQALPQILALQPHAKIIIVSTLTARNAEISLRALELGAADYVTKPSGKAIAVQGQDFFGELLYKLRILGQAALADRAKSLALPFGPETPAVVMPVPHLPSGPVKDRIHIVTASAQLAAKKPEILVIGCSTGGPQALFKLLGNLPKPFPVPIIIVQHMPPLFTAILARQITQATDIPVSEARDREMIVPGYAYLAPGDFHLQLADGPSGIHTLLTRDAPVNYCRPAVDPLFESAARLFGDRALAVVLTGMGRDGTEGAQAIRQAGGTVLVQDEESSVVWGMPGSIVRAGLASGIASLSKLPGIIAGLAADGRT